MKKATINLTYDAEKLNAVRRYMARKGQTLEEDLGEFLQKLYEKFVPSNVREYIEDRDEDAEEAPIRRPGRPGPDTGSAGQD